MKYRTTYHCVTPSGMHIKSQASLDRLKADDPCWLQKHIWITIEPAFEGFVKVEELSAVPPPPIVKPHWSNHG